MHIYADVDVAVYITVTEPCLQGSNNLFSPRSWWVFVADEVGGANVSYAPAHSAFCCCYALIMPLSKGGSGSPARRDRNSSPPPLAPPA